MTGLHTHLATSQVGPYTNLIYELQLLMVQARNADDDDAEHILLVTTGTK